MTQIGNQDMHTSTLYQLSPLLGCPTPRLISKRPLHQLHQTPALTAHIITGLSQLSTNTRAPSFELSLYTYSAFCFNPPSNGGIAVIHQWIHLSHHSPDHYKIVSVYNSILFPQILYYRSGFYKILDKYILFPNHSSFGKIILQIYF